MNDIWDALCAERRDYLIKNFKIHMPNNFFIANIKWILHTVYICIIKIYVFFRGIFITSANIYLHDTIVNFVNI